jgi:hypothetical protein
MNMKHVPNQVSVNDERHEESEKRLHGRLLRVAQAAWILIAVLSCILFVISLPAFFTQTHSICTGGTCNGVQVSPEQAHSLAAHGISLTSYAWYSVLVTILSTLIWVSVGWLIFWHRSDSWIALLISLQAVTQGASTSIAAVVSFPILQYPVNWLLFLNEVFLFLVFALFPSGRFVPKWIRWLIPVWVVCALVDHLLQFAVQQVSWYPAFTFLFFIVFMGTIVIAQIYRYRFVSTPVQRQQTKWVVFAIATIILADVVYFVPVLFNPTLFQSSSLYNLLISNVSLIVLLIGPVSIYIAVVRYRLYDIDVIINRSLVYGSLTVLLALIYFGLVIGLGSLVRLFTGQVSQSPIVIVASTLAIFVLIQPLRHRIQRIIDRRFYRSKYDAAKIIANFSSTLREEVDLNTLSEHLVAVVQETMQPAHVSLWLREPEHEVKNE